MCDLPKRSEGSVGREIRTFSCTGHVTRSLEQTCLGCGAYMSVPAEYCCHCMREISAYRLQQAARAKTTAVREKKLRSKSLNGGRRSYHVIPERERK